jgi:hypothetical protein
MVGRNALSVCHPRARLPREGSRHPGRLLAVALNEVKGLGAVEFLRFAQDGATKRRLGAPDNTDARE